ncbi:DUF6519 domain-containing protein [Azospirillum picis]|uniref:Photosystem II stability/assembly factor-like uncharacterized protein n=1 Tax=Azospirillum picis TaxID=488438 RepID=A0ABU0MSS8_9PROT|nr:DUF6519 domain-containing protein [Azospirillum picis]MBP2302791.1 photosystem II stability/assembly factor-like uncharacterized protein [Azospirillum picis]MDQ0536547.1 photosystem II stability/assembly factor-like uncharacterized protein [Azospirillum picis]
MKADLSRDTFDSRQHFSSVRLQQGRIITDADWNEQADITRHRDETQAHGMIGPCGGPMGAAGYALVAETNALAVHALDADNAWVLAEDGALLATDNGGVDFALADLGTAEHLRAAASVGETGWVVGDAGLVRRTTDGGTTWTAPNAGTVRTLRGVTAVGTSHAWAVGDGGTVVFTTDSGASWRRVETGAARLYAVEFADTLNGLSVGNHGAILSTGDGGETWTAVDGGTTAHLRALARIGTTRAWVAGERGTILRSIDGGANWTVCSTRSAATLHAIAFRDANEGWAAGVGGTILHTSDGGETWLAEDIGVDTALRGLSVFGAEPAWAVGDGGVTVRLGGGSPASAVTVLPAVNLSISPGRYYIDGVLCELDTRGSFAHQADGGTGKRLAPGVHLLYLNAWQRHVSALAAPSIREIALGGPDTATRAQMVCQVRALVLAATSPFVVTCDSTIPEWEVLTSTARPRLAARAEPQLTVTSLCEIAATTGYRRLENQLYRIEVHEGGASPSFKWSRENGSVGYAVVSVSVDATANETTVRVAARGRDANLDVAVHDCVELTDDVAELTARAGTLHKYVANGDDPLELVLAGVPSGSIGLDPERHPVLRRWDHGANLILGHALPILEDVWIALEDGVEVRFSPGGNYRPGDYWIVPARTITGDVEWPRDEHGDPVAREPAGIADTYCRLGLVEVGPDGTITVVGDCRELFPPLTAFKMIHYVSGDGQDAAPGAVLAQPLTVRVARGNLPVEGARIRFEVESGGGGVGDGTGSFAATHEVTTDASGLAECRWSLGPGATRRDRFQRTRASLLDADGDPVPGQVIVYCATTTLVVLYVSGDGQEGDAGSDLPYRLRLRVTNGCDGIAGVALAASVEEGGGAIVGPGVTDADGYAAFDWRLGAGGGQRATVRVRDAGGTELQRLEYTAAVRQPVPSGGGCEVTIGPGGDFEKLSRELLAQLFEIGQGAACVCFLPGHHGIDGLEFDGNGEARLSIHGCGPTAVVEVNGGIALSGFLALELRNLELALSEDQGVLLRKNRNVSLSTVSITRQQVEGHEPCLHVVQVGDLAIGCCVVGAAWPASVVIEEVIGACRIDGSRFAGPLSFYGLPRWGDVRRYIEAFSDHPEARLEANTSSLQLTRNDLQLLTIGGDIAETLVNRKARGLFQTAVLDSNNFAVGQNVFASAFLNFANNSLLATAPGDNFIYGAMIAVRATAVGNLALFFNKIGFLHLLTPAGGLSTNAANQVSIQPP